MEWQLRLQPLVGLKLQSADALSRFAIEAMQISDLDEPTRLAAVAVTEELGANVMEHSQAEWLEVELAAEGGVAFVRFCDNGRPFDPSAAMRQITQGFVLEERVERSLGLYIVRQLARAIAYTRGSDGYNRVEIEIAPDPKQGEARNA